VKRHGVQGSDLLVGGIPLTTLAKRFGTPLFAYDFGIIDEQYDRLRRALPRNVEIFYALKANPNLAVVRHLAGKGAGADIASLGELYLAKKAGIKGRDIAFAGPGKTDEELTQAIRSKIFAINVESAGELARIEAIARKLDRNVSVNVRLNPPWVVTEEQMIIGGSGKSKFGISEEELPNVFAVRRKRVEIVGVHVFNASQVLSAETLAKNAHRIMQHALRLSEEHDFPLKTIDLGGGLGIPYAPIDEEFDVEGFGKRLDWAIESLGLRKVRFILEPGRYLVAECGVFVSCVVDSKKAGDEWFLTLDGGIHNFLRPALLEQRHEAAVANRMDEPAVEEYRLGGPLCTGIDQFGNPYRLPQCQPGDLVAFFDAGAYGFTESMPLFLSRGYPAEIGVRRARATLIRRRQDPKEILATQG